MKWLEMTAPAMAAAVESCGGVCVVPIGVVEKHGDHLPVGMDMFLAEAYVTGAAALEPVMEFPSYFFGEITVARPHPGTIVTNHQLMWDILEHYCAEISRNGFKKIVLVNGHGGNYDFLRYFTRMRLEKQVDYTLYLYLGGAPACCAPQGGMLAGWDDLAETTVDGHGGEFETSFLLHVRPDLVKMDALTAPGLPQGREQHLTGLMTATVFYADAPMHYYGDGAFGTAEKGKFLLDAGVVQLAETLRRVKADTVAPALLAEYYAACASLEAGAASPA